MPEFARHEHGVELELDAQESRLLLQLTKEYADVLRREQEGPVHDRLYPAAYGDEKDEAAYKDLIGDSLTTHKLEALEKLRNALNKRGTTVTITGDDFDAWIQCVTDMRLVIGTRLEVDETRMAEHVSPRDPDAQALTVLHWLGWLTEGLIQASSITEP